MKNKIVLIVLSVLLVVAIGWGVITTGVAITGVKENQQLIEKVEALSKYSDLLSEYSDNLAVDSPSPILTALGNQISVGATTLKVNDDTVIIVAPYFDGIIDKIVDMAETIVASMWATECKTCIIMIVDDNGDCKGGLTIHSDGSTTIFVEA